MLLSTALPKKGFIPFPQGNDPILTLRLLRRDSGLVDSLDGELVAVQQIFHSPEWRVLVTARGAPPVDHVASGCFLALIGGGSGEEFTVFDAPRITERLRKSASHARREKFAKALGAIACARGEDDVDRHIL